MQYSGVVAPFEGSPAWHKADASTYRRYNSACTSAITYYSAFAIPTVRKAPTEKIASHEERKWCRRWDDAENGVANNLMARRAGEDNLRLALQPVAS